MENTIYIQSQYERQEGRICTHRVIKIKFTLFYGEVPEAKFMGTWS